jgi:hypothetical protein
MDGFERSPQGEGSPPRASEYYRSERQFGNVLGETWVLWSELAAVNWDEGGDYYID